MPTYYIEDDTIIRKSDGQKLTFERFCNPEPEREAFLSVALWNLMQKTKTLNSMSAKDAAKVIVLH